MIFSVQAHWDPEAEVWWAESNDIIGLVAEAPTYDCLRTELSHTIPEIMDLNNQRHDGPLEVRILADEVLSLA